MRKEFWQFGVKHFHRSKKLLINSRTHKQSVHQIWQLKCCFKNFVKRNSKFAVEAKRTKRLLLATYIKKPINFLKAKNLIVCLMPKTKYKNWGSTLHCAATNSCKKFCTVHILEQHKNAVAKEKVNIVAVDSTHGKNSNASRSVGRSQNPVGSGGR